MAAFTIEASDLGEQLSRWLRGLDDPDLDGYLSGVGLRLEAEMATTPWAGLSTRLESGVHTAHRVWRFGPAEQAGLMVGDEVLAIDTERVRQPEQLSAALRVGACHALLIARRGQLRTLQLSPEAPRIERYKLRTLPDPSSDCLARQQRWLSQAL